MKLKKKVINTGILEDAMDTVTEAITDLNEFFDEIKNSEQFTKYIDDGEVISKMMFNTLVAFTIGQIVDMAKKAVIINNKTNKPLSPEVRFAVIMNEVLQHMQRVAQSTASRKLP